MMVTVSGLRVRIERSGHLPVIESGFEQGSSDSRALLLNLTLLCFPKTLLSSGGFPPLALHLGPDDSWWWGCPAHCKMFNTHCQSQTRWHPHISRHQISLGVGKMTTVVKDHLPSPTQFQCELLALALDYSQFDRLERWLVTAWSSSWPGLHWRQVRQCPSGLPLPWGSSANIWKKPFAKKTDYTVLGPGLTHRKW